MDAGGGIWTAEGGICFESGPVITRFYLLARTELNILLLTVQ